LAYIELEDSPHVNAGMYRKKYNVKIYLKHNETCGK
jgi:hypothetical protein